MRGQLNPCSRDIRSFQSSVSRTGPRISCHPTSELVGYFHSSTKRGLGRATFLQSYAPDRSCGLGYEKRQSRRQIN